VEFRLVEFLSFRSSGACFLIPAFIVGNGSSTLAQVANEHGKIIDFRPIEAEQYHREFSVPLGEVRSIGSPALFAVRLVDGGLLHGDFVTLRTRLAKIDLEVFGSPFFNVDAYGFIGNRAERHRAAGAASVLLADERIAREWRGLEAVSSAFGLQRTRQKAPEAVPASDLKERYRYLVDHFGAEHWVRRWTRAWRDHQDRGFLRELALKWLASPFAKEKASGVIPLLLLERPIEERVVDAALGWLERAPWPTPWGVVWDAVFGLAEDEGHYRNIGPNLLNDAREFLLRFGGDVPGARWGMAWSKLRARIDDEQWLLDRALEMMPYYEADSGFQKRVLARIFRDQRDDRHFDEEIVVPWLDRVPVSNTWITTFVQYRHALTPSIIQKALVFIRSGNNRFAAWPMLWRALEPYESRSVLDDAATGWLGAVATRTRAWPGIMLEMLHRRPHDLRLLALADEYAERASNRSLAYGIWAMADGARRRHSVIAS
jgi:hypothetical protein